MQAKKTTEDRIRDVYSQYSFPPLEVIIPILQRSGRGEQELAKQLYERYANLTVKIRDILGLEKKSIKTLVKVWGVMASFEGVKIQPIELNDTRYSFSLTDCPMLHVGKNVDRKVKSQFCDLICNSASKALLDTILGSDKTTLTWDKALIKGASKCTITFATARDT
jgi:hypothetical protein